MFKVATAVMVAPPSSGKSSSHSVALTAEVAVVCGGPACLTVAIALAAGGIETVMISPPARQDHRTTALLLGSVTALETLEIWDGCRADAAPEINPAPDAPT